MSMKFYQVLEDGTLDEENEYQPDSTKVVIIVDDQFKRIFLWKGANSGIKKKFIGSRAAAELRKTYYGFAYRLSVVEEGDETQEFDFTIKRSRGEATVGVIENGTTRGIPTSNPSELGLEQGVDIKLAGDEPAKPIIYTDRDKAEMTQFAGSRTDSSSIDDDAPRPKRPQPEQPEVKPQRQRTILSEMMGGGDEPPIIRPAPGTDVAKRYEKSPVAQPTPPKPTPTPPVPPPTPQPQAQIPKPQQQKMMTAVDPTAAFEMIKELGVPAGFERDLVIVGTGVYKQQGENFLVPPNPPEGVFLASDRVPRIIIENGVVKVIEVLKKIDKQVKEKDEVKLDQDIEDLMSTFQIEIE
ncbi:MAG: hypothetical protein FK734_16445 [Asgard group archaeon]|nr:hypothetical protein [Asgard group archaeon]